MRKKIKRFEDRFGEVLDSKHISSDLKVYLQNQRIEKLKWAKCFIMQFFTAGVYNTSRVEF